jgi:hypothetical protein
LTAERINDLYPSKRNKNKENWQWRTQFSTRKVKVEDDYTEEQIFEHLDKFLKDIKGFEEDIKSKF